MNGKKRKYWVIMFTFIFLFISFYHNTYALKINNEKKVENYFIVDKNNNGDFSSIQKAIEQVSDGSTIFVKNGEYNEIIDVYKSVVLLGEDKRGTLINPISEKNKYAVRLGAQNIKIKNFGIINRAPGLYTTALKIVSSNNEIENCYIYETPVGISIWASGNLIKNCEFWGCKDEGIAIIGWKDNECKKNIIENCLFYENCDGIELQYSSSNIIKNCEFYDNTHTGIDAIASSNDKNQIINCKIYKNRVNVIYLSSSSDNKIIDCDLFENKDGNIVMNKYSENNQIIDTNNENIQDTKNLMQKILNVLKTKNFRINKFLSLFNF